MKRKLLKNTLMVLMIMAVMGSLLPAVSYAADQTFTWESAFYDGSTVKETVGGITVSGISDIGEVGKIDTTAWPLEPENYFVGARLVWLKTITFTFSESVDIRKIYVRSGSLESQATWTYTPNGDSNQAISHDINLNSSQTVDLNWTEVTSFTVTSTLDKNSFGFDDLVIRKPTPPLMHNVEDNLKVFSELTAGYSDGSRENLTVTVTSTKTNNNITATLSGDNPESFTLTENLTTLNNGQTGTFSIMPKSGLAPGTYNATVTIISDEFPTGVSFTVQQRVIKAEQEDITYNDVNKTYGDEPFTHTASGGSGSGAFSYTSSDTDVATIDASTGLVTILKPGTTTLTATNAGDSTYNEATDTCIFTINKKALTATATADNKNYDGNTTATGSITLAGKVGEDDVAATGTFTFADADSGADKTVHVTDITLGGAKSGNYTVNDTATATAAINKADITGIIIFNNTTVTYDGTAKAITITGDLPAGASVSYTNNTGTGVGSCNATAEITGGTNYSDTTLSATLTINKKTLTATVGDCSKTYGEGNPDFTVNVTGFVNGETAGTAAGYTAPTASTTATAATGVGTAEITISGGSAANYIFNTTDTGTLTINKKTLTATVGDYSKTYGEGNPAFTVEVNGFVNGETAVTAAGYTAPTASTTATATTDAGTAAITISGGAATNYTFDTTDTGALTINKKALTATATADNKTYDGNTTTTGSITLAGKVGADDVTATGTFTFADADSGADKTVHVTDITLGGAKSGNYTVNDTATATAAINKADITGIIIFNNTTVTYDGTAKAITITGDLPAGASVSYTNNTGTGVGSYNATAVITDGTNYNGTTLNATLTINKAELTATLGDYSKTYGEGNPDFAVEVTGFVNGETAGTATDYIAPTASTTATATGVGTAEITISGGSAANYTFNITDTGTLTINKKTLTATVGDYSKTYGEGNPDFTVEVTGFVNDETAGTADGYTVPTASTIATETTDAGTAAITISGGAATNYTFDTTDTGTLSINKKALTATATADNRPMTAIRQPPVQ